MGRLKAGVSLLFALVLSGAVLDVGFRGAGPLPPLGAAFSSAEGVWTMASGAGPLQSETLKVPGLQKPVSVRFDARGIAYIKAATNHDLFLAIGYLQAKNRLFEMDLMRRQGEGLLSQVVGPAALSSDKFELQLGLLRTARANWLTASPATRRVLEAYSTGVNDVIRTDEQYGTLPVMFKLLGYRPAPWTPIDTLIVQGDMTQSLDYTTAPIEYRLLSHALGYRQTMAWFPIQEPNAQHPYDLGPYRKEALAPIESQSLAQMPADLAGGVPSNAVPGQASGGQSQSWGQPQGPATAMALEKLQTVSQEFRHTFSDSNNWAVSGAKTANGGTMLAGDPHLTQTLPAIWYQIAGSSPSYHFSGVSIPGVPMILIGFNQHIAWSLTNVQNQATLFYQEKTSPAHPGQYYWNGAWRPMTVVHYEIPVKGGRDVPLAVRLTVHGPLMTQSGQTLAVDWMGALPSQDVQSMLGIIRSKNFSQFREALSLWHAPTQNFIYADDRGNIGLISAGYYPEVAHGNPWMPLAGTGPDDIQGTIAYNAIPQSYDPASHLLFSANQREVTSQYPYYIGNALDFFSTGYRADRIYATLHNARHLTPADFAALQNNVQDVLAQRMAPSLVRALSHAALSSTARQAAQLMQGWNGTMAAGAPQPTIWWYFINQYMKTTFGPWWRHVPVSQDANLALNTTSEVANPLVEDLEAWTLKAPHNSAFTLPDGTARTAPEVMVTAFRQTIATLSRKLGPDPKDWQWGKVHARNFQSLAQIPALGYGPRGSSGDSWTVDAADGGLVSHAGPSWRMIVNWQGPNRPPFAEGVYPGGQSENPLSPLYMDQIPAWWTGRYYRMHSVTQVETTKLSVWRMTP